VDRVVFTVVGQSKPVSSDPGESVGPAGGAYVVSGVVSGWKDETCSVAFG